MEQSWRERYKMVDRDAVGENEEFFVLRQEGGDEAGFAAWQLIPSAGAMDDILQDPFSNAMLVVRGILEIVLDDGVSGSMNETEHEILEKIARIVTQEGGMEVNPRVG